MRESTPPKFQIAMAYAFFFFFTPTNFKIMPVTISAQYNCRYPRYTPEINWKRRNTFVIPKPVVRNRKKLFRMYRGPTGSHCHTRIYRKLMAKDIFAAEFSNGCLFAAFGWSRNVFAIARGTEESSKTPKKNGNQYRNPKLLNAPHTAAIITAT
mmetsp:Transcript_8681/g.18859  ORF Transcript_8681/g.18859 Transcript_8681/m.18859 type:complete len:154 (+) Transcript_8681:1958-2419(+)